MREREGTIERERGGKRDVRDMDNMWSEKTEKRSKMSSRKVLLACRRMRVNYV